jgi:hypothetical protein
MFKVNQVIKINGKKFEITKAEEIQLPGVTTWELTGTREGDPSFLSGKRTVFSGYLKPMKTKNSYKYNWDAK